MQNLRGFCVYSFLGLKLVELWTDSCFFEESVKWRISSGGEGEDSQLKKIGSEGRAVRVVHRTRSTAHKMEY